MCVLRMAQRQAPLSDEIVTNELASNKTGLVIFCAVE